MKVRRLNDLSDADRANLLDRNAGIDAIREDVANIIDHVRTEGDTAVQEYSRKFDDIELAADDIDITARVATIVDEVEPAIKEAITKAASNIRSFHERQLPTDWRDQFGNRELGRLFRPISRVGVYVPGGTAAYPSSALMAIIPATVAGVDSISVTTPPTESLNPVTMAAIAEAGADRVYQVGGAQAVAALAYGTETISPVDKIVGPGNRWVTAAKEVVRREVAIDFLAGPSELFILADATANPDLIAADLVAQAEHDTNAAVVAATNDEELAAAIVRSARAQIPNRVRKEVIRGAFDNEASGVFLVDSMEAGAAFAESYAPEHLAIVAENDEALLEEITSAGSVFLGPMTPVAAGDYASGTNHILPTNRGARVVGGLSVDTFLRSTTVQRLDRAGLQDLHETIVTLAQAEGLEAHARSITRRFDDGEG